jgi:hypothetical protein
MGMNGMWLTLAADVLDRNKMSALVTSVNVGTEREPVWEPRVDVAGVTIPIAPRMMQFVPIPNLDIDAIT